MCSRQVYFVRRPPPGNDNNEQMCYLNIGKDDYDDRKNIRVPTETKGSRAKLLTALPEIFVTIFRQVYVTSRISRD